MIRLYWETIGTRLSHGKDPVAKLKDKIHKYALAP